MDPLLQLRQEFDQLKQAFYKNNFSTSQTFTKDVAFTSRLKVPHLASVPATGSVGELIEVGGILYICSSANNFTKVGLQT